jgi:hypothetical protein
MKLKVDRIVSIATLIAALTAIVLVLKKPSPVPSPQAPVVVVQPSQAHESAQPQATQQSAPGSGASDAFAPTLPTSARSTTAVTTPVSNAATPAAGTAVASKAATGSGSGSNSSSNEQSNSDAISAALSQLLGGATPPALTPDSNVGSGAPVIKDQQVTMDGDVVHGKFLTQIAGKDVWVTISGHMGEKDGYATFDPTEFKVGDTSIPVSVVNPMLQQKLAEERDRLKITGNSVQ